MKKCTVIFLSVLLIVTLTACGSAPTENGSPLPPPLVEEQIVPSPVTEVPTESITLLAAGDNLIHDVIYRQARARAADGKYDFIPAYSAVMPIIQAADIAVINQETILASDVAEVSSYPCFCSPTELGEQLMEIGFDVFTQANNHSYDKGSAGIRACMDFWDKHPKALPVGIYRDAAERDKIRYTTVKGIKLAFLAATEYTNGLTLPADATEGVWQLSDTADLRQKLAEARQNADFVVFSPHWGVEGTDTPTDEQRRMARLLVQWGADMVLGTHPHALQPCETITRADGTEGFVIYSLGNFISAQQDKSNMAGGLLEVTLEKNGGDTSRTRIVKHRFIPTVTQYGTNYSNLRIIPFADYTPALAASHGVGQYSAGFDMNYLTELYKKIYPR